jgi:hypothetical protein
MVMGKSRALVGFVAALLVSWPLQAATLSGVQGSVMVNPGSGYYLTTGPTNLKPGDVVMLNPGGSAQLTFPDGCIVPLQAGTVITVGATSPCLAQTGPGQPGVQLFDLDMMIVGTGVVAAGGLIALGVVSAASP